MGKQSARATVLASFQGGPKKAGELIEACGYSAFINFFSRAIGDSRVRKDCWDNSPEQHALTRLLKAGEVLYRRDRQQTVWYLLPGQRLPRCKGPSVPKFRWMCLQIYKHLSAAVVESDREHESGGVGKDDVWHSFGEYYSFGVTLSLEPDGFELADGDPICNWCGQTFTKLYRFDTKPEVIARRIMREICKQRKSEAFKATEDQCAPSTSSSTA